jgi:hypothetical protein
MARAQAKDSEKLGEERPAIPTLPFVPPPPPPPQPVNQIPMPPSTETLSKRKRDLPHNGTPSKKR